MAVLAMASPRSHQIPAIPLNQADGLPYFGQKLASAHRQLLDHAVEHRLGALAHLVMGEGLDGMLDENDVERRQAQRDGG